MFVLLSFVGSRLSSQDTSSQKILKVFLPFQYNDRLYQQDQINYSLGGFQVVLPTLNLAWTKKGITHEAGLHLLKLDHRSFYTNPPKEMPDVFGETREVQIGLQGYYSFNVNLYPDPHLQPMIGVAISPYFHHQWREPINTYGLHEEQTVYGNTVWLLPRLDFNCGKQVFFELSVPIALLDTYWIEYFNAATGKESPSTFYSLARPPLWRVQLAVGYHLWPER
ncbi:MAG: hypothetical protein KDC28_04655 [Saprospiraceae bacterium]|nr:hypothetical protein [Saprospiraceae bacterium]